MSCAFCSSSAKEAPGHSSSNEARLGRPWKAAKWSRVGKSPWSVGNKKIKNTSNLKLLFFRTSGHDGSVHLVLH